jgi:hypothetical protein
VGHACREKVTATNRKKHWDRTTTTRAKEKTELRFETVNQTKEKQIHSIRRPDGNRTGRGKIHMAKARMQTPRKAKKHKKQKKLFRSRCTLLDEAQFTTFLYHTDKTEKKRKKNGFKRAIF